MSWADLLTEKEKVTLPWIGGRSVLGVGRRWKIRGDLPNEYGWYEFEIDGGKNATLLNRRLAPDGWEEQHSDFITGYIVGDRLIPDDSGVALDPSRIIEQTIPVHFVEAGLERFSRVLVVNYEKQFCIYARQEFPLGPESSVLEAFFNGEDSVSDIPEVTPALNLAFHFESRLRFEREEKRRQAAERRRLEAERREREQRRRDLIEQVGSSAGRRALAHVDFETSARAALAVTGSELLDVRDSVNSGEKIVQFRFSNRRFECVADANTLQIIDAGICLRADGEVGDTWLSLESLPSAISEAMRTGQLHVYRRV